MGRLGSYHIDLIASNDIAELMPSDASRVSCWQRRHLSFPFFSTSRLRSAMVCISLWRCRCCRRLQSVFSGVPCPSTNREPCGPRGSLWWADLVLGWSNEPTPPDRDRFLLGERAGRARTGTRESRTLACCGDGLVCEKKGVT